MQVQLLQSPQARPGGVLQIGRIHPSKGAAEKKADEEVRPVQPCR